MALTSGFYNSVNGDRKYNAEQLSSIFDGLINDGILYNVGNRFNITALSGNNIQIGSGRAWFNHTWVYNDSNYTISLEDSSTLLNRIDAVVLEINRNSDIRSSQILIIKGEESSSPSNPTLIKNEYQNQYPLAYIYRKANSSSITQEDITIKVGTEECPYVTGILPVEDIDKFIEETSNDIAGLKHDSEVFYNDIENNSYKIGDLKTTTRSTLGDKWLLCNGDGISASDYPDLASLLGDISKSDQWRSSTVSSDLGSQVRYANGYYLSSNRFTTDIINGPITSFTVQSTGYARSCGPTVYSNGIYYTSVYSKNYGGPNFGIVQNSTLSSSTVEYIILDDTGQGDSFIKVLDFVKINSYYLMLVLFVVDSTNTSDRYDHTDFTLYLYRTTSNPTVPNNWSRTTVWTDEYDFGYYYTSYTDASTNIFYGKIKYVNGRYIICGSMFKNIPFIAYSSSPSYFTIVKLEDDVSYDSEYFKAGATDVNYAAGRYVVSYNIGSSSSTTKFAISSTSTLSSSTTWTKISTSVPGPIGDFYYLDGCYYVPDGKGSLWTGAQPNSLSKFVSPFGTLSLDGRPSVLNVGSDIVMVYPLSGSYKTIYYKASDVTLPSISLSDSAYTYIKALE